MQWRRKNRGFTLLELILILGVVGATTLLLVNTGSVQTDEFKRDKTTLQMQQISIVHWRITSRMVIGVPQERQPHLRHSRHRPVLSPVAISVPQRIPPTIPHLPSRIIFKPPARRILIPFKYPPRYPMPARLQSLQHGCP